MTLRRNIYKHLFTQDKRIVNVLISILIIVNVICIILESDKNNEKYGNYFYYIEIFSIFIFTIEYIIRLIVITENEKYKHPFFGRLKYIFTFYAIIDLLAIVPFYFPLNGINDLMFLRSLRLIRFFRILKIGRYSKSIILIGAVLKSKKSDLITTFGFALLIILLCSIFIYLFESEAQPEKFSNIFDSIYWSVITLTTVGYGDVYPITFLGKVFTMIISILGLGLIAIPAGIIISGFTEELSKKVVICPHCNKEIK